MAQSFGETSGEECLLLMALTYAWHLLAVERFCLQEEMKMRLLARCDRCDIVANMQ